MKAEIKKVKTTEFSPFSITFTFHAIEEYRAFNRMMNRYYNNKYEKNKEDVELKSFIEFIKGRCEGGIPPHDTPLIMEI